MKVNNEVIEEDKSYNILVTGVSGFLGNAIFHHLHKMEKYSISVISRKKNSSKASHQSAHFFIGDLNYDTDWSAALTNQDVVIHTAARAHCIDNNISDPLIEYRRVNVEGTINLATQAASQGVRRFIFISSIGVNGGHNKKNAFKYNDEPEPWNEYTQSKYEAELALLSLSKKTGMEVVIIRPPLIYGEKAPGNFGKLIKAVMSEQWLPLGKIDNLRSFVALDNIVDLIVTCIDHPNAANQIFLVSDDQDVSTTKLLHQMAIAFGKKARLIPIPMKWLCFIAGILGRKAAIERLCGTLQVDITHTKDSLNWRPPVTMEQQLAKIAISMQVPSRNI